MLTALMQQGTWWCPMCPPGHGWGWGTWIWMILFWAVVISLIVYLVIRLTRTRNKSERSGAEEILRERYARGEIDSETYHRMLNDLKERRDESP